MRANLFSPQRTSPGGWLAGLLCSLLLIGSAYAQTGSSTVNGTVEDTQKQAISGATVTLKNDSRNFSRVTTTGADGAFLFTVVPPGAYSIEVEAPGFKKAVQTDVQALVDNRVTVGVTLEVGQVSEVVSVSASTAENILNTQDASLGNNFLSQQIIQLPLNARNVGNLLSLQPAVTSSGYVAGGRSDQANLTIDGVDANDQQDGTAFSPVIRVSPDTVEEFRVTTVNANSTQGRSSGAQVGFITKSGTNSFHGNLYEYHRNTITTANNFFSNRAGRFVATDPQVIAGRARVGDERVPRPKLIRNNFGGSLGGPIIKDRFFFFYNYEGRRDARGTPAVQTVPLASLGRGEVRFFASNGQLITLTASQINGLTSNGAPTGAAVVDVNPAALAVLASAAQRYPSNDNTVGDGLNTGGFRFNQAQPARLGAHTTRLDFNLSEAHTFFVRSNYQNDTFVTSQQFPDTPVQALWSHPKAIAAAYIWSSSKLINDFRFGFVRDSFSQQGDSSVNAVTFRQTFSDRAYARTFDRVTPVTNFTDNVNWRPTSAHSFDFGTNIRLIRNQRTNFAPAFDNGVMNHSFYASAGAVVSAPVNASLTSLFPTLPAGTVIRSDWVNNARIALAQVFGRLSQYSANFNFGLDGKPLATGSPSVREFAAEEYDGYGQDVWRLRPNLTLTVGLRYGLSRPVYETQGFQTRPDVGLEEYLNKRIAASKQGVNFTDQLKILLSGPANDAPGIYPWDKNNFQPRISAAWNPKFNDGFMAKVFGKDGASTFRGGFAITNDYFGQRLALGFDANNTLGFASTFTISANTFNVTTNPAPLFTGLGMNIRSLPRVVVPGDLVFPKNQPLDDLRRIEGSLDTNLRSPINYVWNFTYSRLIPGGLAVEASYIGRYARKLLATRDAMALNNIVDPKSGQDWYTAAGILQDLRIRNTPISQIPNLPFFDNLYARGAVASAVDDYLGTDYAAARLSNTQAAYAAMAEILATDWTSLQDALDLFSGNPLFFNRQYGALSAYGTIASSDYHGASLSVRQRFKGLTWDLNYTFSKSLDDASGLQTSGVFGAAFILNPLRQRDNRSVSDFDVRHILNFNSIWDLPVGKGKALFGKANTATDYLIGGWALSTIMRYNSGLPLSAPFDNNGWATNWNVRSIGVRVKDLKSSATRGVGDKAPNLFGDQSAAYQSFRSPRAGETGDRNVLRYPGFVSLDFGLSKIIKMPYNENHNLQFRWDVFNATNTQRLTSVLGSTFAIGLDPFLGGDNGTPTASFGNLTAIQGEPRLMQFALRYQF
ncbi:MAG TPA: TonB-dependent receptor [Blastocatellia bacterium]|nr:TonB-dependent receptor [Blastocatellia bacterium]